MAGITRNFGGRWNRIPCSSPPPERGPLKQRREIRGIEAAAKKPSASRKETARNSGATKTQNKRGKPSIGFQKIRVMVRKRHGPHRRRLERYPEDIEAMQENDGGCRRH